MFRRIGFGLIAAVVGLLGCGDDDSAAPPAAQQVRAHITRLAPAANIGHRGTGVTRRGHPYPENSLISFGAAIAAGAEGIELDVELTADGALLVMHDDKLNRTTTCMGCVSDWILEDAQECRLLGGDGVPTNEAPPTLAEVFDLLPADALVNVELKAYGSACLTESTGPAELARVAAAEIRHLGVEKRSFFSSFNRTAAATLKEENPDLYTALLYSIPAREHVDWAIENGMDAIHPLFAVPAEDVDTALSAGLQVNIWTVNEAERMVAMLDIGATALITDEPAILAGILSDLRPTH